MKKSKYQIEIEKNTEKRAIALYKSGLTMREVGEKINRSRQWVCNIVNEKLPSAFKIDKD